MLLKLALVPARPPGAQCLGAGTALSCTVSSALRTTSACVIFAGFGCSLCVLDSLEVLWLQILRLLLLFSLYCLLELYILPSVKLDYDIVECFDCLLCFERWTIRLFMYESAGSGLSLFSMLFKIYFFQFVVLPMQSELAG